MTILALLTLFNCPGKSFTELYVILNLRSILYLSMVCKELSKLSLDFDRFTSLLSIENFNRPLSNFFYETKNYANRLYIRPDISIHSGQEFVQFKEFSINIFTKSTSGLNIKPNEVTSLMITGKRSVCDDITYRYLGMILNRSFPSLKTLMLHNLCLEEEVKLVDYLNLDLLFLSNCVLKKRQTQMEFGSCSVRTFCCTLRGPFYNIKPPASTQELIVYYDKSSPYARIRRKHTYLLCDECDDLEKT